MVVASDCDLKRNSISHVPHTPLHLICVQFHRCPDKHSTGVQLLSVRPSRRPSTVDIAAKISCDSDAAAARWRTSHPRDARPPAAPQTASIARTQD